MARLDMGLLNDEIYKLTERREGDQGFCQLQLPAPVLEWQSMDALKAVKFYFGTKLTLFENCNNKEESKDYFICFGDQINTVVFICAIYIEGDSLPVSFLCMEESDFKNWLFPKSGNEVKLPHPEAWGVYNSIEFCQNNMDENHKVTVHLKDNVTFGENIVIVITHLAGVKTNEQYSFIFKFEIGNEHLSNNSSNDDDSDAEIHNGEPGEGKKLTPAQKSAITKASNKTKSKGRHMPTRGPSVNVLKLLEEAHKKAADKAPASKSGRSRSTKKSVVTQTKVNRNNKQTANRKPSPGATGSIVEPDTANSNNSSSDTKTNLGNQRHRQSNTSQPTLSAMTGELMSALTAVVGAVKKEVATAASHSIPSEPKGTTKKEQLAEDEDSFELYHKKRMKDLTFMESMTKVYSNMSQLGQQPMIQTQEQSYIQQPPYRQQQSSQYQQQTPTFQQMQQSQGQSYTQQSPCGFQQQTMAQQQYQQSTETQGPAICIQTGIFQQPNNGPQTQVQQIQVIPQQLQPSKLVSQGYPTPHIVQQAPLLSDNNQQQFQPQSSQQSAELLHPPVQQLHGPTQQQAQPMPPVSQLSKQASFHQDVSIQPDQPIIVLKNHQLQQE